MPFSKLPLLTAIHLIYSGNIYPVLSYRLLLSIIGFWRQKENFELFITRLSTNSRNQYSESNVVLTFLIL